MTPTQRSLQKLRADGYIAASVEKWIAQIKQRKDVWGFGDLLACRVGEIGCTLIQTTTKSNMQARVQKIVGIAEAGIFLAAGNRIVVHGWSKKGAKGKRKVWVCDELSVTP